MHVFLSCGDMNLLTVTLCGPDVLMGTKLLDPITYVNEFNGKLLS